MLSTAEEKKKLENSALEAHNLDGSRNSIFNVSNAVVSPLTEALLVLLRRSC